MWKIWKRRKSRRQARHEHPPKKSCGWTAERRREHHKAQGWTSKLRPVEPLPEEAKADGEGAAPEKEPKPCGRSQPPPLDRCGKHRKEQSDTD